MTFGREFFCNGVGYTMNGVLVFTNPVELLVIVAGTAGGSDYLLQGLWSEDEGAPTVWSSGATSSN